MAVVADVFWVVFDDVTHLTPTLSLSVVMVGVADVLWVVFVDGRSMKSGFELISSSFFTLTFPKAQSNKKDRSPASPILRADFLMF